MTSPSLCGFGEFLSPAQETLSLVDDSGFPHFVPCLRHGDKSRFGRKGGQLPMHTSGQPSLGNGGKCLPNGSVNSRREKVSLYENNIQSFDMRRWTIRLFPKSSSDLIYLEYC